uniref:HTH CENPB-type domain-containing protein n=1 Tax=Clastoptera arizonana TaxID=38151 RepID=A0A1B6BY84_9HEMI
MYDENFSENDNSSESLSALFFHSIAILSVVFRTLWCVHVFIMSAKRKHITLSLSEKLAVLQRLDKGESLQKIAKELNVGVTTIKDWRKNRKDIESHTMTIDGENALKNRKTLKKPKLELLDSALWMWFSQERRKGTPISGPIIKEKAIILHKKLEVGSEFKASEGWIDRWKTRHGIRFISICGEKLSADAEAANEFSVKFQEIVKENELLPCQVKP